MGNARPEPPPRNRSGGGGGGGGAARGSSGPTKLPWTRASVSAMRNDGNDRMMDTPGLPAHGGSGESGSRRQQKGAADEARQGVSKTTQNAKEQMAEHDRTGNITIPSKKRKRMDTKTYRSLFKPYIKANPTDAVVSTPDRLGKENTCSGHVADRNIVMSCEGGSLIENRKKHSNEADQCTAPFSEVHLHKPNDTYSQNKVVESNLPVDARDRSIDPARQCSLSSLQCAPIPRIQYEEPKSALGDGQSISIQKEDSASRQSKVTSFDEAKGDSNICAICGMPGTLKSCDGKDCKRRYHVSCLDPSLESLSPGIFFCTICMKKSLQFDLHSTVDGIESVWDVKEGMKNGKRYFVKYKNLAHAHNCWVPETDVINGTPGGSDLLSLFNMKNHKEKTNWKEEWTKPHHLLKRRPLNPPKLSDDLSRSPGANFANCNVEWLVKWRRLGYDGVTWELETSPFLRTREADELKKNYENRHKAANQASIPTKAKVKQSPVQNIERLADGCHFVFDNDHLHSINQLRGFWHNSRSAVLIDDKERVIKTILFIMSILPDACQPFLIVTSPASLSLWEDQFNHLAPFITVVVYDGGKDMLKLIQNLEFYENESCMLQILLSQPDAILEDIEAIECIGWEAVIVDYYQNSAIKYFEQLKQFSTDFRMLLLSSPVEDNLREYGSLLAFLNPGEEVISDHVGSDATLVLLKARFIRHIAYEHKADSSKFLEHWVPAYISQVQLKIYCSILLSKSSVLQSQMKSHSVGALYDILWSLSKCCDHPYLVDDFLQNSPVNNHDLTDTRASGKLLLLDNMLKEIRNKRLRVIILFQSDGGADGNPTGNMLESFVRHRFGPKSYERVERRAKMSSKLAAINMFNDEAKGRFVFLIESGACLPSVKLLSVDAIIIYGSDWNPQNDLKALKKIKIQSQLKYLNIFRLYTPFTVEEKSLMLAKQGMLIDSNIQDVMANLSHSLLSWGASVLFNSLDGLQQDNGASISSERGTLLIAEVISEFVTKLPTNIEDSTKINSTSISEASMRGEFYSRNITLIGEKERMPELDRDPSKFWSDLLDEKSSHIMLQNKEEPAKIHTKETDEARGKHRKIGKIMGSSLKVPSDNNNNVLPENCTTLNRALQPPDGTQQKIGVENVKSTPKNLHVQLKQELSKLIKGLQLPDNVNVLVEQFFEYLLKNHLVALEPKGTLHALNIALCWHAASLHKYKVDRRESLALAKKCLNYECNEELAGLVYETLKKKFTHEEGETSSKCQETVENTKFSSQDTSTNLSNDHTFTKEAMDLHGNVTNGTPQEGSFGTEQVVSEVQELIMEKRSDLVDNVFSSREKNIRHRQWLEISELEKQTQNEVSRLKEICNLVLEHIRRSQIDEETKNSKMKKTIQWFTMLMYAFLEHMRLQHDKLEALQYNTWSKERHLKEKLQEEAKSGQLDPAFDQCIALPESNFVMEEFIHFKEQNDAHNVVKSYVSNCQQHSNETSQPITSHAVRNGRAEALDNSGRVVAPEAVDFPENIICRSSGCIGLQRTGGSSNAISENDGSIDQESLISECTRTEHVERDNVANPSMSLGGLTSPVAGVNAINDGTADAGQVHLEPPVLASSHILTTLSVSREVSSMSVQQTVSTLEHLPADTERTNVLGIMAAGVLQLEMQTPTSTLDAPILRTRSDDMSQTSHQRDTAPGLLQGVSTSYHVALGDVSMGVEANDDDTVAADQLHSETQSYSVMHNPAALPALHPEMESAAAEAEVIMVTEAARDCQPEMQPSTSMQDQLEEAEREGTDLSTSVQDQPEEAERESTDLSFMPMLQSTTANESVDLPYEGVERAVSSGMVTAHELQSEIQPSASMQDQPVEAQGAGIPGTTAAQDLQLEMQPVTTMQHVPIERRHYEDRSQIDFQANMASDPAQASQLPSAAMIVSNYRVISNEPLKNELERLKCCIDKLYKSHEQKKALLLKEYTQEIEKAKGKYDSLLKEEDSSYLKTEMELDDLYKKGYINQTLAENFREKFMLSTAAQGRSTSPVMRQPLQSSRQAHAGASVSQATALPVASSSATRPPVFTLLHSPGTNVQPSMVGRPSSSWPFQPQPILPSNTYRGTPSPFVPMPRPHGGHRAAGARTRAPTHLQQPRMPPPYAMVHTNQQQLPVCPAVTSFRQFAHGNMDGFSTTGPLAGALVSSMAPSSVHQTMLSSSNPCPVLPVSSLLSGLLPESMLSSSSDPILRATEPSSPNMVFYTTSAPLDAAGSWRTGAQIAGVNQSGSESASLNGCLTTRLGLPSNTTGRGTNAEVVCLSDDES